MCGAGRSLPQPTLAEVQGLIASRIRFPVDPRDVPPEKAARRLHLTLDEFESKLAHLRDRGFPGPDPTTGMYDLKAIDAWMDRRWQQSGEARPRDARDGFAERLAGVANG